MRNILKKGNNTCIYFIFVFLSIICCCSCTSYITHNDYIWNYNFKTDNLVANLYKVSNDSLFVFICDYSDEIHYRIILDLKNGKRLGMKKSTFKNQNYEKIIQKNCKNAIHTINGTAL